MRKFTLIYLAFMLALTPVASLAASKQKQKNAASSAKVSNAKYTLNKNVTGKYKLTKHSPSAKLKASKLNASRKSNMHVKLRKPVYVQPTETFEDLYDGNGPLQLASAKALVINQYTGEVIYEKNTKEVTPIASVTKLMTAMVVLDAKLPMDEVLYISEDDIDYLKGTRSRLSVGTALTRAELLRLALMSSENRAASALAHNYPGGIDAFLRAMNRKATSLGMRSTKFYDATGLDSNNVSTAEDLVKMVKTAYLYDEIRQESTTASQEMSLLNHDYPVNFVNTNALVRAGEWMIGLSKTGYISEAGRCLVMQAEISGQSLIIILLDAAGKSTRIGDANRVRKWVENNKTEVLGEHVSG